MCYMEHHYLLVVFQTRDPQTSVRPVAVVDNDAGKITFQKGKPRNLWGWGLV